jgi:hypothetical protein
LAAFEGNLWAGAKARLGLFIDEKADELQRKALQTIFAGEAGGWPAGFAATIGEFRGVEFVPISFRARRGTDGTNHSPWQTRADDQSAGIGSRSRTGRDMGPLRRCKW